MTIDIHCGGAAPTGRLQADGGPEVPFDGWLQLLGALRDAIPGNTELPLDTNPATHTSGTPRRRFAS